MRVAYGIGIAAMAAAAVVPLSTAAAAASPWPTGLATQSCDDRHGIRVCITYERGGFTGSVHNRSSQTISPMLTATDQRTWKAPIKPTVAPGKIVTTRKNGIGNGHACAGLYVPSDAAFPEWTACIN